MDALVRRMALSTDNLEAEMEEEDGDNGGDDALSQWVMVTAEGYQHEATQDEMEEVLEMSREMMAKTSGYTESSYEAERRRKRGSTTSRTQVTSNNSTTALRQRVIGSDPSSCYPQHPTLPLLGNGAPTDGVARAFSSARDTSSPRDTASTTRTAIAGYDISTSSAGRTATGTGGIITTGSMRSPCGAGSTGDEVSCRECYSETP